MMGSLFWGYIDGLFFTTEFTPQALDFFGIYLAGHQALENESVYAWVFGDTSVTPYVAPFRYVPFFSYAFAVPINILPHWWAYWGWVAFNEALLVVNAYTTSRLAGRGNWGMIAAAMWFAFTPFYLELYLGQFSFLMATAIFWTGIGIVRRREVIAGIPWALSLVVKSNTALLGPLFLRLGWWRSLLGGAALVALNVPYFLWRPHDLRVFFDLNFAGYLIEPASKLANYRPGYMGGLASLHNTIMAFNTNLREVPAVYSIGLVLLVMGGSLMVTFLARRVDRLVVYAVWVAAFFLTYDVVWESHYVMLLPVLVLLVAFRPALRPWALAAFVLVALPTPHWMLSHVWNTGPIPQGLASWNIQYVWPEWGVVLYHGAKPLPVAVLWAYLVISQVREGFSLYWLPSIRALLQRAG